MKRILRDNSLTLLMLGLFLLFIVGQSVAGYYEYNQEQTEHQQPQASSYMVYLSTGHFLESVFENWESEFLQMGAYVALTGFLFQRGSSESKDPDKKEPVDEDSPKHRRDARAPWPVRKGGIFLKLYEHSLSIALFLLFLFSFSGHALGGTKDYNEQQIQHGQQSISVLQYMGTATFWFESFQNWQSEFLSVGALAVLSVWLREKGSPESKPVYSPHKETGD
jgi:hypothetical protein